MADHLWLKKARTVLLERGFGLTHHPVDVAKQLSGEFEIEPFTGCACPKVSVDFTAPMDFGLAENDDWFERAPWSNASGFPGGWWQYSPDGAFTATTATALDAGAGFLFGFLAWPGTPAFTLTCGGGLSLEVDEGRATLKRGEALLATAQLWDAEEWSGKPHYLYVYNVGTRVCARRLGPKELRGLSATDNDADKEGRAFALKAGTVSVSGSSPLCFAVAPETHATTLEVEHELIALTQPLTSTPELELLYVPTSEPSGEDDWVDPDVPLMALLDADGAELDTEGEGAPDQWTEFAWRVTAELSSANGPNLYLNLVRATWPETVGSDGLTGTDLMAVAGVKVESIEERLGLDGAGNTLRFTARADDGVLSSWVQAHMTVEWWADGELRFRGLTTRPSRESDAGMETLSIDCDSLWKRFRNTRWAGAGSLAGYTLPAAYTAVVKRAGFTDAEIVVYDDSELPPLPAEDREGKPLFDFKPEQTVEEVLLYLRDTFQCDDILRFKPDGKFHAERPTDEDSGVEFVAPSDTDAAELAALADGLGAPRIVGADSESLSEEGFGNVVVVVGLDKDGNPLVCEATDWASLNDPTAFNYVGEERRIVIIDPDLQTQAQVDWTCRQVYDTSRLLRIRATWKGQYVPGLLPGDLVTANEQLWRLLSMQTIWDQNGPAGMVQYEGELAA